MTTPLEVMAALSRWFAGASWDAWRTLLAALSALALTVEQLALYRRCTGRTQAPTVPAREAWLIIGRRGGKSLVAALLAVWAAAFRHYTLVPGERGLVMVIAADRRQARVVTRYTLAMLEALHAVTPVIERRTAEAIHLLNGISIEVHTASFRTVRGYTVVAAICDEIAFWPAEESTNPDEAILAALRPAMATVPGALLLCISSPYARRGALWQAHRAHFGQESDPVLCWQADSATMNPSLDPSVLAEAYARDEVSAAAEYGAQFRSDVERYVSIETVDQITDAGVVHRPPIAGVTYRAFVDPSGGSQDAMTLGIAHAEDGLGVLDLVVERRPPFSPEGVVEEFAAVLREYHIAEVMGDRYGGEWPREQCRKHGVAYTPCEKSKSDLYRELLPKFTSGRVRLLDQPRLRAQLLGLERRVRAGAREVIDHGSSGSDDLINAAAGALWLLFHAGPEAAAVLLDPPAHRHAPAADAAGGGFHGKLGPNITALLEQRQRDRAAAASGFGGFGRVRRGFWR